jgi:hypothetical protein
MSGEESAPKPERKKRGWRLVDTAYLDYLYSETDMRAQRLALNVLMAIGVRARLRALGDRQVLEVYR